MKISPSYILLVCLSFIFSLQINAQNDPSDEGFLDFWIGEWRAEWADTENTTGKGRNHITTLWSSDVVHENFEVTEGLLAGFKGKSYSAFDKTAGVWKQTWVDNQNAYLEFTGTMVDGDPCFQREFMQDDLKVIQRMVFHDIEKDSFTWDWEVSTDGGKTWKLNWQIFYTREEH